MTPENNDGPSNTDPAVEAQPVTKTEDKTAGMQENTPKPGDPEPSRTQKSTGKSQKKTDRPSWKDWVPFRNYPPIFAIYYVSQGLRDTSSGGAVYYSIGKFVLDETVGGDDKAYLRKDTHIEIPGTATGLGTQRPSIIQNEADRAISQVPKDIALEDSDRTVPAASYMSAMSTNYLNPAYTHDESSVSASSTNYLNPAYTITVTSSTTTFKGAEADDTPESNGPVGVRPGFGFTNTPILEALILGAVVTITWIATWQYL
ncbi:hypothetical protein NPX13_g9586 [Xylaria arbuscula]|uniref:Uncharacterized protein n=1 Tax=Xylaria arbuscula TaxID=114810 RepID=A0A9W8N6M9_9PEZI|nr:hypothetical protein NPX13_g9586 [Xylaria arbuscula]